MSTKPLVNLTPTLLLLKPMIQIHVYSIMFTVCDERSM